MNIVMNEKTYSTPKKYTARRYCEYLDCTKYPVFNIEGKTQGRFCKDHKHEGMIDVMSKRCEFIGCNKQPTYGFIGGTTRIFCSKHRQDGMINIKHRKCDYNECNRQSTYGFERDPIRMFCKEHKHDGMIDIRNKKCEHAECNKQPNFGLKGETPRYCTEHKLENMIDVINPKCQYPDCTTIATRGLPAYCATHCAKHSQEGHIPHPKSKCRHFGCKEQALYTNKGGGTKPLRCKEHKEDDDINCVERICVSCGLLNILDPSGKCYVCDPNVYNTFALAKQNAVIKYLQHRDDIPKPVSCDSIAFDSECKLKYRPDIVYISPLESHYIVVEVDEKQHKDRNEVCECTRMINIAEAFMKPTLFIRYNPDDYKVDGKKQQITDNKRRKILAEHLKYAIDYPIEKIEEFIKGGSGVYMKQLFYDGFKGDNCEWIAIH